MTNKSPIKLATSGYEAFDYETVTGSQDFYQSQAVAKLLAAQLQGLGGTCLDLACGSGLNGPLLAELGFEVTGVDISPRQVEEAKAHGRIPAVLQADASELPFEDNSFDVVVSVWSHTDFESWADVMTEVARVLKPGGYFVYVGAHLAFFGAQAQNNPDGSIIIHPNLYHTKAERLYRAPGFSKGGIRSHVGERHLSEQTFYNALWAAGLSTEQLIEGETDPPTVFSIKATLPPEIGILPTRSDTHSRIAVLCGWSPEFTQPFLNLATDVGAVVAEEGHHLVYGASTWGMMGAVSAAARAGSARVIGVSTAEMQAYEEADTLDDELHIVANMNDRKQGIISQGDIIVVLPGGLGTVDELLDVVCLRVKGLTDKPVIIVDFNGYYDGLLAWFRDLGEKKFIPESLETMLVVRDTQELRALLQKLA